MPKRDYMHKGYHEQYVIIPKKKIYNNEVVM